MSKLITMYNKEANNPSTKSSSPTIKSSLSKDKLFDPTIDMMVNDFDDERTLEEEEALAAGEAEDPHAELCSLQKEGDMPLEELLALYGYGGQQDRETDEISEQTSEIEEAEEVEETEEAEEAEEAEETSNIDEDSKPIQEASTLHELYDKIPETDPDQDQDQDQDPEGSRLLRSVSRAHSEEEEDDYDYSPDEDEWKKTIMVGSDYQAQIPEGLCSYDDALPYENEDKLLWDPSRVSEAETEEYLKTYNRPAPGQLPFGSDLRDDEQALFSLLQCGFNVEEALRRKRINSSAPAVDTMSLWSEDECRNFESGLRNYGKNFHLIQQNKVRTRSVGELVQFYYLWKKTERHDVFANKARLEKKKYTLHPGLTDFMDRFLEEQDGSRDRSSSPSQMTYNITIGTDNKIKVIIPSNSANSSGSSSNGCSSSAPNFSASSSSSSSSAVDARLSSSIFRT